jgi:hypothetical protein
MSEVRDGAWLERELERLLQGPFLDVEIVNPIVVKWGRRARGRFGSIALRDGVSVIIINGAFREPGIPAEIVRATLAHELAHYAHGFSSEHRQAHPHPHRGGVVDRELGARGLGELAGLHKRWAREEWPRIAPLSQRRTRRRIRDFYRI